MLSSLAVPETTFITRVLWCNVAHHRGPIGKGEIAGNSECPIRRKRPRSSFRWSCNRAVSRQRSGFVQAGARCAYSSAIRKAQESDPARVAGVPAYVKPCGDCDSCPVDAHCAI